MSAVPARPRVGILVALREEMRAVQKSLTGGRPAHYGSFRFETANVGRVAVVAARTGMGKKSAAEKTALFLEHAQPDIVLATGFAGALEETAKCGEIFLAREVWEAPALGESDDALPAASWTIPERLVRLASQALEGSDLEGRRLREGRLLTVAEPVTTPAEKIATRERFDAQALEMESSAILKKTQEKGVPTLCVRALLDEVGDTLPFDFGKVLTPEGRVRPLRALAAVAANPAGLRDVEVLRRRAASAAASLTNMTPRLVEALAAALHE